MKITDKYVELAKSNENWDPEVMQLKSARSIIDYTTKKMQSLGVTLIQKKSSKMQWSTMTTAMYRDVYLGSGWEDKSMAGKAQTLSHELVHLRQWRKYGPIRFALRYIFSSRFRWAMEIQAYRMSVAVRKTLRVRATREYINARPEKLRSIYKMKSLSNLKELTIRLLQEAYLTQKSFRAKK